MSNLKPLLKRLLKRWIKIVAVFNNALIFVLLLVIWIFILTPTAFLRKLFQIIKPAKEQPKSWLKKSISLDPKHFIKPF